MSKCLDDAAMLAGRSGSSKFCKRGVAVWGSPLPVVRGKLRERRELRDPRERVVRRDRVEDRAGHAGSEFAQGLGLPVRRENRGAARLRECSQTHSRRVAVLGEEQPAPAPVLLDPRVQGGHVGREGAEVALSTAQAGYVSGNTSALVLRRDA